MEKRDVPYIVFEGEQARNERHFKRLWAVMILLIVLLVSSNGLWIWYESQFEEVITTQEVTQELEGDNASNNFVGGNSYGESKADSKNNN